MDEFTIRLFFLALGLVIGWIAGMSFASMKYSREAMDQTRKLKKEVHSMMKKDREKK